MNDPSRDSSSLKSTAAAKAAFARAIEALHERRRRNEISGFDPGRRSKAALEDIHQLIESDPGPEGETGLAWAARIRVGLEALRLTVSADGGDVDGEGGGTIVSALRALDEISGRM